MQTYIGMYGHFTKLRIELFLCFLTNTYNPKSRKMYQTIDPYDYMILYISI